MNPPAPPTWRQHLLQVFLAFVFAVVTGFASIFVDWIRKRVLPPDPPPPPPDTKETT